EWDAEAAGPAVAFNGRTQLVFERARSRAEHPIAELLGQRRRFCDIDEEDGYSLGRILCCFMWQLLAIPRSPGVEHCVAAACQELSTDRLREIACSEHRATGRLRVSGAVVVGSDCIFAVRDLEVQPKRLGLSPG